MFFVYGVMILGVEMNISKCALSTRSLRKIVKMCIILCRGIPYISGPFLKNNGGADLTDLVFSTIDHASWLGKIKNVLAKESITPFFRDGGSAKLILCHGL